jgi:hypothetical protein
LEPYCVALSCWQFAIAEEQTQAGIFESISAMFDGVLSHTSQACFDLFPLCFKPTYKEQGSKKSNNKRSKASY